MDHDQPNVSDKSESRCLCASLSDLAVVRMGWDGLDDRVFVTIEKICDHGGDQWWLHLERCRACGQHWMVAQEERIYDDYYLRRLDQTAARKITDAQIWPDEFITYERVLKIGRALSSPCAFADSLSSALVCTVQDLRRERPDISILEIAHLLGIPPGCAAQLLSA